MESIIAYDSTDAILTLELCRHCLAIDISNLLTSKYGISLKIQIGVLVNVCGYCEAWDAPQSMLLPARQHVTAVKVKATMMWDAPEMLPHEIDRLVEIIKEMQLVRASRLNT